MDTRYKGAASLLRPASRSPCLLTQRGLPPHREGHVHLRWTCPEAVGRASVCPGPLRLRILAGREDSPTSRPSAASRRNGRGMPTCGGHAPRQSAALPFVRGRSGSESSRDARILRLRDPARPPAATGGACPPAVDMPRGSRPRFRLSGAAPAANPRGTRGFSDFATQRGLPPQREGHAHLRWTCPEAVGRASVCPGPLRLRILAGREDSPTSRPSAASRRNGTGMPTCGGHAPRQSAALPFVRGRSGSESSRDAEGRVPVVSWNGVMVRDSRVPLVAVTRSIGERRQRGRRRRCRGLAVCANSKAPCIRRHASSSGGISRTKRGSSRSVSRSCSDRACERNDSSSPHAIVTCSIARSRSPRSAR